MSQTNLPKEDPIRAPATHGPNKSGINMERFIGFTGKIYDHNGQAVEQVLNRSGIGINREKLIGFTGKICDHNGQAVEEVC